MELFRAYVKARVQEGQIESFKSLAPEVINIVKNTEPEAFQCEVFANEQSQEVVWLVSFKNNKGYDFHLTNTALDEIRGKIMPLQEEIRHMFFMAEPTEFTINGLKNFGMHPTVLTPWPGTNRLTEERGSDNLQIITIFDANDLSDYRNFSDRIEQAAATHPGLLYHRVFQGQGNQLLAYGEWADTQAMQSWMTLMNQQFEREFQQLISNLDMIGCGALSPEIIDLLNAWNASIFSKIAGFTRFEKSPALQLK